MEKRRFEDVFPKLKEDLSLSKILPFFYAESMVFNEDRTLIHVHTVIDRMVPYEDVRRVEALLKDLYCSEISAVIRLEEFYDLPETYTLETILQGYRDGILKQLSGGRPSLERVLNSASITADDDSILFSVEDSLFTASYMKQWTEDLKSILHTRFSKNVRVVPEIRKAKKRIHTTEEALNVVRITEKTEEKSDGAEEKDDPFMNVGRRSSSPAGLRKGTNKKGSVRRFEPKDPNIVYGRAFSDEPRLLNSFQPNEEGSMTLHAEITAVNMTPLKNGEKTILLLDLTDRTDSISAKIFVPNESLNEMQEKLQPGTTIRIKGSALMDAFEKELVLQNIVGICLAEPLPENVRTDTAKYKRVELHCHTKMSRVDAIASAKDLVKRAKAWGHKALAITDHGGVYAFPEAFKASKDSGVKILYGMEGYLVDDTVDAVLHPSDLPLSSPTVIFDLETTGLSPVKNRIIEIGAVKIDHFRIVDRFSCFVDPEVPIPLEIEVKTHVSDEMVNGAPTIDAALPSFMSFIEGCALVAHNASFDVGFIKENARRLNVPFPENVTVIDTLSLSRRVLTKLSHFRLDQVAKELGVMIENHHRAVFDAECTVGIYLKLIGRMGLTGDDTFMTLKERSLPTAESIRKLHSSHIILIAKNETGRVNLYRLCSEASLDYFHEKPLSPRSVIQKYREGLIIGSACSEGELYEAVLNGASEEEIARIVNFYDYLEVQPVQNNDYLIRQGRTEEELLDVNREIVRLGEQFHKPVCATGDVHFMDPEDAFYRQVLQEGNGFKDAEYQPPLFFKTTDEMLSEFGYLGSDKAFEIVVTNTNKISDMVESISPVRKGKFPPVIPNAAETLKEVCYKTAHGIYGDTLPDFVNDRLERELNSIISNGYAVMYLIARKLVMKSVSDGYVVGSRGSVGSSLVATMSGITEVNPLKPHYHCPKCHHTEAESEEIRLNGKNSGCDLPDKTCPICGEKMNKLGFDIPFETFLGFKGDKEPDIDLNFSGEYQTKAHAYTEVIFGKGQTFRAGTISGIKDKTAIGYFRHYFEEHGEEKRRAELERLSKKLEGVRKTTGQHPGGIVVLPFGEEIQTFTPIQHPSDKTDTNIITTSFEYHAIDENLLKLDILGHDDPTMIRMIEDLTGLDPTEFPLDAPEVIRLFQGTEVLNISPSDIGGCPLGALGIPEFGTEFAMNMVIACKPVNFSDLVRISGMAHGENVWSNNNQILFETGIADLSTAICCRDDIMLYLISMGMDPSLSFSIMEKVRKGKGLTKEWEEEMSSHGVPDWYIDSCNKIKYMFPKAHAVAYVMMAWRIAYCKIHYPTAFYCSFFSIRADEFNYEKMAEGRVTLMKHMERFENTKFPSDKEKQEYRVMQLVNEFYARGFRFVPLDLDKANATLFTIADEKSLMPSLTSIDGMGEAAADSIIQAVQTKKPFSSVQNFRDRTHVSQTIIEKLLSLKILKDLPRSDQFSLFDEMG